MDIGSLKQCDKYVWGGSLLPLPRGKISGGFVVSGFFIYVYNTGSFLLDGKDGTNTTRYKGGHLEGIKRGTKRKVAQLDCFCLHVAASSSCAKNAMAQNMPRGGGSARAYCTEHVPPDIQIKVHHQFHSCCLSVALQ